jgi:hypothetical protein
MVKSIYFFWMQWQELCLSIKIEKESLYTSKKSLRRGFKDPWSRKTPAKASGRVKTAKRKRKLSFSALCLPWFLQPLVAPSLQRSAIGTFLAISSHQALMWIGSLWGCDCSSVKFSQESIWSQTAFANGQHKHRCRAVSKGPLQRTQWSWCGHPLFCRFCAVRILSCTRIQTKILHLFFTWAFHIRSVRKTRRDPLNWIW